MISFNYWLVKDLKPSESYFFDTLEEFENFVNYIFEFVPKHKKVYVMMELCDEEAKYITITNNIHKHLPYEFARLESIGNLFDYEIFEFENKEDADEFIQNL